MSATLDRSSLYRLDEIETIVRVRTDNLMYLRRFFDSDNSTVRHNFWMNTIELQPDLGTTLSETKGTQTTTLEWFCLGRSLADLQMKANGAHFVRSASQLMEEFSFFVSNVALQRVRQLKYIGSPQGFLDESTFPDAQGEFKPRLCRLHGSTVFQFLQMISVPFSLDLAEVVTSLCDILILSYKKFIDDSSSLPSVYQLVLKLDAKFKHFFFGLISRRVTDVAVRIAHEEVDSLRHLMSVATDVVAEEDDEHAADLKLPFEEEYSDGDGGEEKAPSGGSDVS